MKYTEEERTLLINLYEIRKALALQNDSDSDSEEAEYYEEKIEILRCGYEILYSDLEPSVAHTTMPEEDSKLVLNILQMYYDFEDAYSREGESPDDEFATFRGFCGNYEGSAIAFARFVIEKQGRFPLLKKFVDDLNSHMPLLPFYKLMLEEWEKLPIPYRTHQLTNEAVLNIIESAKKAQKAKRGG